MKAEVLKATDKQSETATKTKRRKPKQKRALEKYQAVLDASIIVLMREGYDGANTSNIAREANVAVGSLYEYFPNKESIYMAYLDERIEKLVELIQQAASNNSTQKNTNNRELLRQWVIRVVEGFDKNSDLLKALVGQVPGVLDLPSLKDLDKQLLPLVRFLAIDSKLTEAQIEKKTHILTNVFFGFLIRSLFSELNLSSKEKAEELLSLIVAYAAVQ